MQDVANFGEGQGGSDEADDEAEHLKATFFPAAWYHLAIGYDAGASSCVCACACVCVRVCVCVCVYILTCARARRVSE
jgi:hypothetical protein